MSDPIADLIAHHTQCCPGRAEVAAREVRKALAEAVWRNGKVFLFRWVRSVEFWSVEEIEAAMSKP